MEEIDTRRLGHRLMKNHQNSIEPIQAISLSVLMPVYNERYLVEECIKRVLNVQDDNIAQMELIIVDDGSTDGTREILRTIVASHPNIRYIEHDKNMGKGKAIRTALGYATGDICIIQDADLEYLPQEYSKLIQPFLSNNADAVLGSRFLVGGYTAVLNYYHRLLNKFLAFLVNIFTNMTFTDIETCYKAIKTDLFKSIPLQSNDFRIEPELVIKLSKRRAKIYEVPISYSGRTYTEGKKISWVDGLLALGAILKYSFISDEYYKDDAVSYTLHILRFAKNFNKWTAELIKPFVGQRVLEIGAGIGNLSSQLLPRDYYLISDINDGYLKYHFHQKHFYPFVDIKRIDVLCENDFSKVESFFDTIIASNVIEHVEDDRQAMLNIRKALRPEGKAIILVPCGPYLFSDLDRNVGHKRRYTENSVRFLIEEAGFIVEKIQQYNKLGRIGWFINGNILKKSTLSPFQIRLYNLMIPLLRHIDHLLPWRGLTLIIIAKVPTHINTC
jgi:glycosyltransferase involved in cell wall biosynthesis